MRQEIKTSKTQTKFEMAGVGIAGLVLFIFTSQIFKALDSLIPIDISLVTTIFRIIVAGTTIFAVYMTWQNDKRYRYFITDDSIIISRSKFGRLNEDTYTSRNITSISVKQSMFGVKNNYGTIIINSDKLYNNQSIQLKNIINPKEVADKINEFLIRK
jgi:hypothetical protein